MTSGSRVGRGDRLLTLPGGQTDGEVVGYTDLGEQTLSRFVGHWQQSEVVAGASVGSRVGLLE
jgi:hypothetical protein